MIWQNQQQLGMDVVAIGVLIGSVALMFLGRRIAIYRLVRFGPRKLEEMTTEINERKKELREVRLDMRELSVDPDEPDRWVGLRQYLAMTEEERLHDNLKTHHQLLSLKLELLEIKRDTLDVRLEAAQEQWQHWHE